MKENSYFASSQLPNAHKYLTTRLFLDCCHLWLMTSMWLKIVHIVRAINYLFEIHFNEFWLINGMKPTRKNKCRNRSNGALHSYLHITSNACTGTRGVVGWGVVSLLPSLQHFWSENWLISVFLLWNFICCIQTFLKSCDVFFPILHIFRDL